MKMLKEEYQHLKTFEAVNADTNLKDEQKKYLKYFLKHLDSVNAVPSKMDKTMLAKAYYGGKFF